MTAEKLLYLAALLLLAGCAPPEADQAIASKICTDAGLIPDVRTEPMMCAIPAGRLHDRPTDH